MKKSKKKSKILQIFLLILILLAAAAVIRQSSKNKTVSVDVTSYKTEKVKRGAVVSGISESGTVTFGTQEQNFSVAEITEVSLSASSDSSSGSSEVTAQSSSSGNMTGMAGANAQVQTAGAVSGTGSMPGAGSTGQMSVTGSSTSESQSESTSLITEEVYLSVGQVVKEGDPILKITQDSIEEYRTQLEAAVTTAKRKVSQEEINVESKRAEADYTYEMNIAEGETAEETYQATITSLEKEVTKLEEELEEAQDDGDEDEIEELEAELQIAKNNLATQSIEAKQTYENAMTNYKYAQQLYEIDTDGLEDDLNDANETLEEAEQNLADFEEQIGDGIVYSDYSGTVTALSCEAGNALTNDSVIVTFTDPEEVTMTVSVSQNDISRITVGDTAEIQLTAYSSEKYSGEVTGISTSSQSGSSTVNYDVTVRFKGDTVKVYSGMTGDVLFAGKSVSDTLYVSNRAVFQKGAVSCVKILEEDGTVRTAEIKTGFSNGTIVEVQSGLEEGDSVIIESRVTG